MLPILANEGLFITANVKLHILLLKKHIYIKHNMPNLLILMPLLTFSIVLYIVYSLNVHLICIKKIKYINNMPKL